MSVSVRLPTVRSGDSQLTEEATGYVTQGDALGCKMHPLRLRPDELFGSPLYLMSMKLAA